MISIWELIKRVYGDKNFSNILRNFKEGRIDIAFLPEIFPYKYIIQIFPKSSNIMQKLTLNRFYQWPVLWLPQKSSEDIWQFIRTAIRWRCSRFQTACYYITCVYLNLFQRKNLPRQNLHTEERAGYFDLWSHCNTRVHGLPKVHQYLENKMQIL